MAKNKTYSDLPNLREVEEKVLGEILNFPCIETAITLLTPSCFMDAELRMIYEACVSLNEQGKPIDITTAYQEVKKEGGYANAVRLSKLSATSDATIENDCKMLIEYWMKREIIKSATNIVTKAKDDTNDAFELLNELTESVYKIENHLDTIVVDKNMWQEYESLMREVKEKMSGNSESGLMSTTFPSLNKATGGIMKTDYVIIYGKYKMGKTTVAEQLALDIAFDKKPIGIFALEMERRSLYYKAISMRTGIDYLKLRNPKGHGLTDEEFMQTDIKARELFARTKIYVDDKTFNINRILSKAKIWKRKFGVELLVIDYLGLMESDQRFEARYRELSEYSRRIKNFAKEIETPIILLSQANDDNKTAESKNPARDADFVISVSKPLEDGKKSVGLPDGGRYEYTEDDFLVTLEHSRHGKNKQNFVCSFINNNFVEKSFDYVEDIF